MHFKSVLAELARPDAQRADWLAWASDQLSHAFIGAVNGITLQRGVSLYVKAL